MTRQHPTAPPGATPMICTRCGAYAGASQLKCPRDGGPLVIDLSGGAQSRLGRLADGLVGHGGGGVVFSVRHLTLDRPGWLRVLSGISPPAMDVLRRRLQAIAGLSHPRVARIEDCVFPGEGRSQNDELLVCVAHVDGQRLDAVIEEGTVRARDAVRIIRDVGEALGELHAAGLSFGHLVASDVMLTFDRAGRRRGHLVPLGLGHPAPGPDGPGRPTDDIHALGVLLHDMLTPPGERRPRAPSRLDDTGLSGLGAAVSRMLDPNPGRRPSDGLALAALLTRWLPEEGGTAASSVAPPARGPAADASKRSDGPWRTRALMAGAAALMLALVAAAGWLTRPSAPAPGLSPTAAALAESTPADLAPPAPVEPAAVEPVEPAAVEPARAEPVAVPEPAPAPAAPAPPPPIAWPEWGDWQPPPLTMRRGPQLASGRYIYAARTEVTGEQWRAALGNKAPRPGFVRRGRAVGTLTPGFAAWFTNRLSQAEGLTACYAECPEVATPGARACAIPEAINRPCDGYRLPGVDEWKVLIAANGREAAVEAERRAQPESSPCVAGEDELGICDLYGGTWEWTETRGTTSKHRNYVRRVGGSWDKAHRPFFGRPMLHKATMPENYVGFRPVRVIDDPRFAVADLVIDPIAGTLDGPTGQHVPPTAAMHALQRLVASRGKVPRLDTEPDDARALTAALVAVGSSLTVVAEGSTLSLRRAR